jgi:hypothetical protein
MVSFDSTRTSALANAAEERRARAALLVHARAACTEREISVTRRAIRAWLEHHPGDVDLLLADEAMTRSPGNRA